MRQKSTRFTLAALVALSAWPSHFLNGQEETREERGAQPLAEDAVSTFEHTYTNRHALVIGIDNYVDPGYQDLSYAVKDAQAMADLLVKQYAFPLVNVRLIINAEATREALDRALQEWACDQTRVRENDLFVLFFAGHGVTRTYGQGRESGYLVPSDAQSDSISRAPSWSTLIGIHDLEEVSPFIPAKHVLIVLDCCFSGIAVRRDPVASFPGLGVRARQVLTAGTAGQRVIDGGGEGHSVFTFALLEGLRGAADENLDGMVTFGEIYAHVSRWVETATQNHQTPVQGTFPGHDGGNVTLFRPGLEKLPSARDRLQVMERTAEERLREVRLLADLVGTADLEREAAGLWPRRPALIPPMRDWLVKAGELYARLPEHEAAVAATRQEAYLTQVEAGILPQMATEPIWDKADTWLRFRYEAFGKLVAATRQIGDLTRDIAARLEMALTIKQRTIDDYADEWEDAIADIAESAHYEGLELEPQVGLVPLEPDPESELWEFWVWETGARPERDDETGRWTITEETGIVLVLLPGGTFNMGATVNPKGPNYDPQARGDESVHQVTLAPFFLSKYEMTQGQWQRVMGSNPSYYTGGGAGGPTHPVENVDWSMCSRTCTRMGLVLLTEAQWEYACRGGTDSVWWTGNDPGTLQGAANLFDRESLVRNPEISSWGVPEPWGDPNTVHAPVGSFRPNAFGLHDVHGNVWEWCADWYGSYRLGHREGDGLLQVPEEAAYARVDCGGSFSHAAVYARSALRYYDAPQNRHDNLGCRPARGIMAE
ncbi:MAG: SUMF1/EgtB/PvdO family nonheme iron enzyme [Planctomycetota bacterium]